MTRMKIMIDFIAINASAVIAFLLREAIHHYPKEPPSAFLGKYLMTLILLNLIYFVIFWFLGAYDRRIKRALLEEFVLVFGVISTGISISMAYFFMGQLWWMSRGVLYIFWSLSILLLCLNRVIFRNERPTRPVSGSELNEIKEKLAQRKIGIDEKLMEPFSIIIVSYNSGHQIKECLDSLNKANLKTLKEIIVVDNASSDGTSEYLGKYFPSVRLIKNQSNLGYSRAVNAGIKNAVTDLYLILNPDMIVLPGSIEIMVDHMLLNPKTGLAGGKLLNEDGSLQYSCRRFLDLRTYLYRFTPVRGIMSGSAIERSYLMQDWDHIGDRAVDWVLGGCMLVRKKACDEAGLMDENIFLYFEDVDWCYRMWDRGWSVDYVAGAAMIHRHMRASANRILSRATYEHLKSLFYFLRKHGLKIPDKCPSCIEI